MLYKQLIQTGSVLMLLPFSSVLGFTLYKDTAYGRDASHQLYSFAIEVGFGANGSSSNVSKAVHDKQCSIASKTEAS